MTRLQTYRQKRGLSQAQLAQKAELNKRTLQDYEQGKRDINQAAAITVYKLANALGLSLMEDLLELGDELPEDEEDDEEDLNWYGWRDEHDYDENQ